jgi:hypothetical protein
MSLQAKEIKGDLDYVSKQRMGIGQNIYPVRTVCIAAKKLILFYLFMARLTTLAVAIKCRHEWLVGGRDEWILTWDDAVVTQLEFCLSL